MKIGGEVIIDTIIDHETKIQTCYDKAIHDIERGTVDKIYGTEREEYTSGMTTEEVAEALIAKGFGANSILVEWSMARCDYLKLREMFENLGLGYLMPPVNNSWLVLRDWIDVVKKSKADFDCRLSLLYIALGPDEKSLPRRAHRARPDTLMLLKKVERYFEWATNLKPKTKGRITDFFHRLEPSGISALEEGSGLVADFTRIEDLAIEEDSSKKGVFIVDDASGVDDDSRDTAIMGKDSDEVD